MEIKDDIKYGKTLRELLQDCNFSKIAEYVKYDKQFHNHVEAFREAYDILLNTDASEDGCYQIEVRWYNLQPSEGAGRILFCFKNRGIALGTTD